MSRRLLVVLLALGACGKGGAGASGEPAGAVAAGSPTPLGMGVVDPGTGAISTGDAAGQPAGVPEALAADPSGASMLLPDSEPAGAPFAASIAQAVAEVTQGGAVITERIYRVAFEQARRQINTDNARSKLREIERQVDLERQALR